MSAILTTITPYWNRPEMLEVWVEAIRTTSRPDIEHILVVVGEKAPQIPNPPKSLRVVEVAMPERFSIGHVHNMGAKMANSEWIMKLDIDTLPTLNLFHELKLLLRDAGPRDWYNIGMIYIKQVFSKGMLSKEKMPIGPATLKMVADNLRLYSAHGYFYPAASNFVCRTQDYLDLGGCDERFNGYGWEDYQQIFMLERYQRAKDPLPGCITSENITTRCREEISRPKAKSLFLGNPNFCLFHRWHRMGHKDRALMEGNRQLLLDYVMRCRPAS